MGWGRIEMTSRYFGRPSSKGMEVPDSQGHNCCTQTAVMDLEKLQKEDSDMVMKEKTINITVTYLRSTGTLAQKLKTRMVINAEKHKLLQTFKNDLSDFLDLKTQCQRFGDSDFKLFRLVRSSDGQAVPTESVSVLHYRQ